MKRKQSTDDAAASSEVSSTLTHSSLPNEFSLIVNKEECERVCCVCLRAGKAYALEPGGNRTNVRQTHVRVYCRRCYLGRIRSRPPFSEVEIKQCQTVLSRKWPSTRVRNEWVKESSQFVLGCWECGLDLQKNLDQWPKAVHEGIPRPLVDNASDRLFCLKCTRKYMIGSAFCGMCKREPENEGTYLFKPSGVRLCSECIESIVQANVNKLHLMYAQKLVVRSIQRPQEYEGFVAPPDIPGESESEASQEDG